MKNSKKNLQRLFKKFLPFLFIVFLVLSFFWKVVLKGLVPLPGDFIVGIYHPWIDYKWGYEVGVPVKNPIMADVPSFMYPMQTFAVGLMKGGDWPLWNPHILSGAPLMANLQSAPFSPTAFVYFLFDKITAWSIQIVLQHILAFLFCFFLLRYWKVSLFSSLLGGLVFSFSGFNLIWSQWNGHTLTAAFIPLILLFESRFLKRPKFWDGLGVSVCLAFQFFSGYPQILLYTAVAMGTLWIFEIFKNRKRILKTLLLIIFVVLGFGLSSPQLVPGAELLSLSQWTDEGHPFEWAFLPWKKTITFVAPDYFGNHVTQNYWGPQDYTSNTGFVGVVAFVLASIALFNLRKKKEIIFSLLLVLITLLISYRTPVSVFLWKNNILGMGSSSAHRAMVLFNLGISFLAAFGMDVFLEKKFKFKILYIIPLIILILLFILNSFILSGTLIRGIDIFKVSIRNMILPVFIFFCLSILLWVLSKKRKLVKYGSYLIFFLMVFELFRFGWKFTPFCSRDLIFPKTPVLEFLENQNKPFRVVGSRVIPVNLSMPYSIESLEGYETMRPALSSKFLAVLNEEKVSASPAGRYGIIDNDTSRLLDLVNTKYYLTLKYDKNGKVTESGEIPDKYKNERFKLAFEDKSVAVMESKSYLPRAFLNFGWEVIEDDNKILEKMLDPKFSYEGKLLLSKSPEIKPTSQKFKDNNVEYIKYSSMESILKTNSNESGMLFVSDTFYPGWKAFVDDKEVEIFRANFAFRAVEIPKGEHLVRFSYQPESFDRGVRLFFISCGILALIGFAFKFGNKYLDNYT